VFEGYRASGDRQTREFVVEDSLLGHDDGLANEDLLNEEDLVPENLDTIQNIAKSVVRGLSGKGAESEVT